MDDNLTKAELYLRAVERLLHPIAFGFIREDVLTFVWDSNYYTEFYFATGSQVPYRVKTFKNGDHVCSESIQCATLEDVLENIKASFTNRAVVKENRSQMKIVDIYRDSELSYKSTISFCNDGIFIHYVSGTFFTRILTSSNAYSYDTFINGDRIQSLSGDGDKVEELISNLEKSISEWSKSTVKILETMGFDSDS